MMGILKARFQVIKSTIIDRGKDSVGYYQKWISVVKES